MCSQEGTYFKEEVLIHRHFHNSEVEQLSYKEPGDAAKQPLVDGEGGQEPQHRLRQQHPLAEDIKQSSKRTNREIHNTHYTC